MNRAKRHEGELRPAFSQRQQRIVAEAQMEAYENFLNEEGVSHQEALLMASIEPDGFGDDPRGTVVAYGTCTDCEGMVVPGLTGPDSLIARSDPFADTESQRQEVADLNLDPTGMMFWLDEMMGGGDDLAKMVMEVIYEPKEEIAPKLQSTVAKVVPRLFLISRKKRSKTFDYEVARRLRSKLGLTEVSPIAAVRNDLAKH